MTTEVVTQGIWSQLRAKKMQENDGSKGTLSGILPGICTAEVQLKGRDERGGQTGRQLLCLQSLFCMLGNLDLRATGATAEF